MKNNKKDLILIIVFIFLLIGPDIIYFFVSPVLDDKNYEKQKKVETPKLTIKNIEKFPGDYENYFNDNLAFKNELRKIRAYFLYEFFHTSSNDQIILGKNNYLFYNGYNDGDNISGYRRINKYSTKEKQKSVKYLNKTNNYLKKKNIDFYIFIAPNKENVYREYVPDMITVNKDQKYSKTEDLINYIRKNTDLNVIYPKQELISKRKVRDTYFKNDTHWNDYGAYLGVSELMKTMEPGYKDFDITFKTSKRDGDLASMNLILDNVDSKEVKADKFLEDVKVECKGTIRKVKKCKSNGLYDKKIVVVGDSFNYATQKYLSRLYKNIIFVNKYYSKAELDKYNPDAIVYISVERLFFFVDNVYRVIVKNK